MTAILDVRPPITPPHPATTSRPACTLLNMCSIGLIVADLDMAYEAAVVSGKGRRPRFAGRAV